jgi:hypothetical protein
MMCGKRNARRGCIDRWPHRYTAKEAGKYHHMTEDDPIAVWADFCLRIHKGKALEYAMSRVQTASATGRTESLAFWFHVAHAIDHMVTPIAAKTLH